MSSQTLAENLVKDVGDLPEQSECHANESFRSIVSREEAVQLAQCVLSADAELVDYYLRAYSEEKIGFLASHKSLVVVSKKLGCSELVRHSFFVKTIPYDIPSQAAYIEHKGAFRKEVDFFRKIEPLMTSNYRGDAWAPRCYLVKNDTLVFEDMKYKGFSNRPRLFDEESTKAAVACLARFHASSLLAEEKLDKPLDELFSECFQESEYKSEGPCYNWFITAINLTISLANDLGLDSSRIRETSERIFEAIRPSQNKRNVVSHGDLWSSNIIFDDLNNCNLVDFQLVRYAPLALDVMWMLYLVTTRQFRKEHETRILEHYHATLKKTLEASGFRGAIPSWEVLLEGAEEQRLSALINATINYPTVMMDGKIGAEIMSGPDAYEEYFFKDRRPFVDKIMALDEQYERRVKESVRELAEMSLVVDGPVCRDS